MDTTQRKIMQFFAERPYISVYKFAEVCGIHSQTLYRVSKGLATPQKSTVRLLSIEMEKNGYKL